MHCAGSYCINHQYTYVPPQRPHFEEIFPNLPFYPKLVPICWQNFVTRISHFKNFALIISSVIDMLNFHLSWGSDLGENSS